MARFLLLGSGELGKEFVIAAQRLGHWVIAADRYPNAPAMQVAQEYEIINMLDGKALDGIVEKHRPDYIVPEIEAIRTERLYHYEQNGISVVPSAKAANYTMNRKAIRDLAAKDLQIQTADYRYATSAEELQEAVAAIGMPCVVKPLMSSSGKGQSTIHREEDIEKSWNYSQEGSRGDVAEVIVEAFVHFNYEITLLTLTQIDGPTLFCPPIGHRQEGGDYRESWQPMPMDEMDLQDAQQMAKQVTTALGGAGIWGVEFFIADDGVYFSELSPRPHDTGMVTLAGTQNYNEFELHLRAILGHNLPGIFLERQGASAVVLAQGHLDDPQIKGLENVVSEPKSDVRIFGKPDARPNRRMAVVLTYDELDSDLDQTVRRAKHLATQLSVE
ncbi:formate-dependent phosphoribosylglycinamide formyltransferase [Aureitalea marina]|uniref:Formate-dependent phosphoribosylglycinamide formyltransferase n=1 Tax=Aureitalea marina TaxID=930804 RepID=A0A2S7KM57_9FLAO|nr:formate-dependent phosphoribosylglycinamide formyltransferase [Aureitalea marina]PQB03715.1 phosphoribosylglycinamide formyltransferase 2 [Aureitalea marina]